MGKKSMEVRVQEVSTITIHHHHHDPPALSRSTITIHNTPSRSTTAITIHHRDPPPPSQSTGTITIHYHDAPPILGCTIMIHHVFTFLDGPSRSTMGEEPDS
ncbi:unnamed protein product [Pleuronectes platessa]|uniref:Uncharacterized protein n=1 Tax=Pleuronectes platessa TaxID=8262 RepID=A0A9N7Z624_PLEPL|nr:unnamed protein product [Pleuronectes platessa]